MSLQGKHILVTGAGKRIGRAMAKRFMMMGAKVTAHYNTAQPEIDSLVEWAQSRQAPLVAVSADLQSKNQIDIAVQKGLSAHGTFDVLVNSASVFFKTPIDDISEHDWQTFLAVNLQGQFQFAHAVRKHMRTGVILNISDSHATHTRKHFTPYIASKAALLQLTRNLAAEWAPDIRVNSISPGPVLKPEHYTQEQMERAANSTLLKRWGNADDVVEAALFLIGNSYITGFDLLVDGGRP